MSERQETIADIIAEKRQRAEEIERDCAEKMKRGEMVSDCYARELVADIRREADRIEAANKRERGDCSKLLKTADLRFDICRDIEQVLKIGRDYQNKDGYRGAHYDTVKLLCDAIEYQQEQLKTKTEVGDAAKLREALKAIGGLCAGLMPTWDGAVGRIKDIAETALAAPPRNCDIYLTEEAVDAATVTVRDCEACSRIDMETPCVFCMVRWLLAPATEKEGGAGK